MQESTLGTKPADEQNQDHRMPTLTKKKSSPEDIANAFQAPYVRMMLDLLCSNPQTFESLLTSNPLLGSALHQMTREQARCLTPHLINQASRPSFCRLLTNPSALRAMMEISESLQVLHAEAPHLMSPHELAPLGKVSQFQPTTGSTAEAAHIDESELTSFLSHLLETTILAGTQAPLPEQLYAKELEILIEMGFPNQEANLQALNSSLGDLSEAVTGLSQPQTDN